ncbi:MAG: rRNA methyltransferase [Spirochaetaceae bacterium]|jgi:ribosomal protein RSM22 (predicted rRNA methylase)|nr:rRNA methyltransferase [Spirochaetaceae bacterium]
MEALFNPLSSDLNGSLSLLLKEIDKTFPVPARFVSALPRNVAELSRLLSSARPERKEGYLNDPALLGAYMRYFLPWNIYRLCKLFSSESIGSFIASLFLADDENHGVIDLGSGPLTLALALWISFPALRSKKITLFCIDHNRSALRAGEKLFYAFTGPKSAWNIKLLHVDMRHGIPDSAKTHPVKLLCAVNIFNEIFWKIPQADTEKLKDFAEKQAFLLSKASDTNSALLVVEPGVPRCGQFIHFLKVAFESRDLVIRSPCPRCSACCMRGGKRGSKWCHFYFDTDDSPKDLQKLSGAAGLSKDKAVLSFLLAQKSALPKKESDDLLDLRVISDLFPLPEYQYGRYACSAKGLVLLRGSKKIMESCPSGAELSARKSAFGGIDKKSGALILPVPEHGL